MWKIEGANFATYGKKSGLRVNTPQSNWNQIGIWVSSCVNNDLTTGGLNFKVKLAP